MLVEVHSYYRKQIEIAAHVDWVYDFALPPLILHAFAFKTAAHLKEWIRVRPTNALTVLDTHDGIGIIDVGPDPNDRIRHPGLVPPQSWSASWKSFTSQPAGKVVRPPAPRRQISTCTRSTAPSSMRWGAMTVQYLLARAIQFFLPGIPQVYYVGLLAGGNDMELLARTGVGRDINRHYYSRDEIEQELTRPVVQELLGLIRLRNTHPAFAGRFELEDATSSTLVLKWSQGHDFAQLTVDFAALGYELRCS